MKDFLIIIPTGFEDIELIATLDILERADITVEPVSIEDKDEVKGKYHAVIKTKKFKDINEDNYKGIYIPGGSGYKLLLGNERLKNILIKYKKEQKLISALCAAPEVLFQAGVINDVRITSYPGMAINKNNTGKVFEVDQNVVTGRDHMATMEFAHQLAKAFKN